ILNVVAGIREAGHLGPCDARVSAAPQSVATRGGEIEHAVAIRIDRESLARTAAGHVAADLERQHRALPGGAAIGRTQDRSVLRGPFVRVRAGSNVDVVWVDRI